MNPPHNLIPFLSICLPLCGITGLRSSGVHSNGYSLVRKCVEKSGSSSCSASHVVYILLRSCFAVHFCISFPRSHSLHGHLKRQRAQHFHFPLHTPPLTLTLLPPPPGLSWEDPAPFQPGDTLGNALLCPTKIYVANLMPLVKAGLLKVGLGEKRGE
jgi:hypothetical protein